MTDGYPPILLFHPASAQAGEVFFAKTWPEARAVADRKRYFYRAFGLAHGGVKEFLAPRVLMSSLRAMAKGNNLIAKPEGDWLMMPGAFLVEGSRILWSHRSEHVGDHPDWKEIPALAGAK